VAGASAGFLLWCGPGRTLDISESMLKVDKKGIQKFYPVYEAKFEDGTPAGFWPSLTARMPGSLLKL